MPIVTALISTATSVLGEIDETYHEVLPDGRMRVVFVTTGYVPTFAKIKTWAWALFGFPVQKVDDIKVEVLQSGLIYKRYKITATLSPLFKGFR